MIDRCLLKEIKDKLIKLKVAEELYEPITDYFNPANSFAMSVKRIRTIDAIDDLIKKVDFELLEDSDPFGSC